MKVVLLIGGYLKILNAVNNFCGKDMARLSKEETKCRAESNAYTLIEVEKNNKI